MSNNEWTLTDIMHNVSKEIERDYETVYPGKDIISLMYIGLAEEAGEVAGVYKRLLRHNDRDKEQFNKDPFMLTKELGDVLWYLAGVAYVAQIDLNEVWDVNRKKLEERYG